MSSKKQITVDGSCDKSNQTYFLCVIKSFHHGCHINKMNTEYLIRRVGGFGRYQLMLSLFLFPIPLIVAMNKMDTVFVQFTPKYRCLLPNEDPSNTTYALPESIMLEYYPPQLKKHYCFYYKDGKQEECQGYVYDRSEYNMSATMEWDLICKRKWLKALGDSIFMAGNIMGDATLGYVSDAIGRKPVLFFSLVILIISGYTIAFSPFLWLFIVGKFFNGVGGSGAYLTMFVILIEAVADHLRYLFGILVGFSFGFGFTCLSFFGYFLQSWRLFKCVLTAPCFVFLTYWFFVPESNRWLLTMKKFKRAKKQFLTEAKFNKITLEENEVETMMKLNVSEAEMELVSYFEVYKYPILRKRILCLYLNFFVACGTYYALSWSGGKHGTNIYIDILLFGTVELPSYFLMLLTLNRFGRKPVYCSAVAATAIILIFKCFIPMTSPKVYVGFTMLAKFTVAVHYGTSWIYTSEVIPTVIRHSCVGTASMMGRVGAMLSPFIDLLEDYYYFLPHTLWGSLAALAAISAIFILPETLGTSLPNTIADGEQLGKKAGGPLTL